jgi:transcriptional regulator with XRE-family HTH domain
MNKHSLIAQENTETISDRLRYLIDKVGIKQVHLANKLGVTSQAIHQLCNGKQHFSKHTQKIAHLLNADETWLKTGQGTLFPTSNSRFPGFLGKIAIY